MKKPKSMYAKDENSALRPVVARLKKVVKESVPETKGNGERVGRADVRHVKLRSADGLGKKGLREMIVAASRFKR